MSIEVKMHEAVASVRQGRGPDYMPFMVGVSYVGWGELGAGDDTVEMTFRSFGIRYQVKPVEGLADGEVALVWQ